MNIFNLFKKKNQNLNSNSKIDIVSLINNADKNTLFVDILFWLEDKSSYGDNINALSKPELHVLVIREFFDEVMNGGFPLELSKNCWNQFIYLIESIKAVGANDVLSIYEETLKLLPKLPVDRTKRYDVLGKILTDDLLNKLSECDKKLYSIEQNYFEDIVYNYVMNNKEYFKD